MNISQANDTQRTIPREIVTASQVLFLGQRILQRWRQSISQYWDARPWMVICVHPLHNHGCQHRSDRYPRLHRLLECIRRATDARPIQYSLLTAVLCTIYLGTTAIVEYRHLQPAMRDEFSYLIQARQFASGQLWLPMHPLAEFFDSFQLLVQPVYASAYFPATALLYVPGIWFHVPTYATTLMISGAISGLLFFITCCLLNGLSAWLAVLLLINNVSSG